jgi:hypothetical protein
VAILGDHLDAIRISACWSRLDNPERLRPGMSEPQPRIGFAMGGRDRPMSRAARGATIAVRGAIQLLFGWCRIDRAAFLLLEPLRASVEMMIETTREIAVDVRKCIG